MDTFFLVVRVLAFWLLVTASVAKASRGPAAQKSVAVAIWPHDRTIALAGIEMATAGALMIPISAGAASLIAAGLFGLFGLTTIRSIRAGRRGADCGCGGLMPVTDVSWIHAALVGAFVPLLATGGLSLMVGSAVAEPNSAELLALAGGGLAALMSLRIMLDVVTVHRRRVALDRREIEHA